MKQIFSENGSLYDSNKITFLSNEGSEFTVYKYFDSVLKIYKSSYKLPHLPLETLNKLKSIKTKRILLPTETLWNKKQELIGYKMPYIDGNKSIENDNLSNFLTELDIIKEDLDILNDNYVILLDINLPNTIYNGQLYLIDPGNYIINQLDMIIYRIDNISEELKDKLKKIVLSNDYDKTKEIISSLSPEENKKIVKEWNYKKINELIELILFSKKDDIDPFKYRQIIQFIKAEREKNDFIYNLDILKMYFNKDLSINESVKDFVKRNIKDNPKERKLFYSFY